MSLDKILTYSGGGLLLLLTFIQLAPIKIDPWSAIARWIGRAINGEVLDKLHDVEKQLANGSRLEILRFNNELLRSIDHTKEEFI